MSIRSSCPHCGRSVKTPDSTEGKKATCPSCGKRFTVEAEAVVQADEPRQPTTVVVTGATAPSGSALARGVGWGFGLTCGYLAAILLGGADDDGACCGVGWLVISSMNEVAKNKPLLNTSPSTAPEQAPDFVGPPAPADKP